MCVYLGETPITTPLGPELDGLSVRFFVGLLVSYCWEYVVTNVVA